MKRFLFTATIQPTKHLESTVYVVYNPSRATNRGVVDYLTPNVSSGRCVEKEYLKKELPCVRLPVKKASF